MKQPGFHGQQDLGFFSCLTSNVNCPPPNPSVSSQGLVGDQWEEHAGMYLYLEVVLIFCSTRDKTRLASKLPHFPRNIFCIIYAPSIVISGILIFPNTWKKTQHLRLRGSNPKRKTQHLVNSLLCIR